MVGGGQMSSIHGSNEAPDAASAAPGSELVAAGHNTEITEPTHGKGFVRAHPVWFGVIVAAAVGTPIAIVKGINSGSRTQPSPTSGAPTPGRPAGQ